MIYNSGGMRHRCWSLVIVNTERGRQVGDVVLHHGPPGNRDVTSAPIRSWFARADSQSQTLIPKP